MLVLHDVYLLSYVHEGEHCREEVVNEYDPTNTS